MSQTVRILIGYDGSECAQAALLDLQRAGLPPTAEVLVMTVADVFLPPPLKDVDDTLLGSVSASVAARAHCSVEVIRANRILK